MKDFNDNSKEQRCYYNIDNKNLKLARAYVPFQKICGIYEKEEALIKGTIFKGLSSPYCKCDNNIMCDDFCSK